MRVEMTVPRAKSIISKIEEHKKAIEKLEALLNLNGEVEEKLLQKSVQILELSYRPRKCLENAKIETIADLVSKTIGEILRIKNMGYKSLREIEEKLLRHGLCLDATIYSEETCPNTIGKLDLSIRTENSLRNAGIRNISELTSKTSYELLRQKNFGRKSLNETERALAELGLRLKSRSIDTGRNLQKTM